MSNQYLHAVGTTGDVMLSKLIKPTHAIFKGKGILFQRDNDVIAGGPIVNIYFVYKTSPKTISSSFVLKNCLFGAVKITNNSNPDTYKWQYAGYSIGFDSKGEFTHPDGEYGKNVIIFGADLSNYKHANNKAKHVLVIGKDFVQEINKTTIYAEKMYSPNFTVDNKTFCLSLLKLFFC